MKKYYTPITDQLSYVEITAKEYKEIIELVNKIKDEKLRLSLTKKLGL